MRLARAKQSPSALQLSTAPADRQKSARAVTATPPRVHHDFSRVPVEADRKANSPASEVEQPVKHHFRGAAVSFLSCVECNPYTDDGLSGPSPPANELFTPSLFRMKHVAEVDLESRDARTIEPGTARLVRSGATVGISGFCGKEAPATIASRSAPSALEFVASELHGEGVQVESHLGTRVDVETPPTLPGAPCGHTGKNPLIPVNFNTFRMRLFADGTKESEFVANSTYPHHYMYHDTKLWSGNHPATDYEAWATSTGLPLTAATLGFKALRFACCHPILSATSCATQCIGGISTPIALNPALPGHIAFLAASSCPSPCGNAGADCGPKPAEKKEVDGAPGGGRGGGGGAGGKW